MNIQNTHPRFQKFYADADPATRTALDDFYDATDPSMQEYARLYETLAFASQTYGYHFAP